MDALASYDDDIYAWSLQQGAALRRLAETQRDLSNELDLENIAEEIETVGRNEVRTIESFIDLLLRHLLKIASVPEAPSVRGWTVEVRIQAETLRDDFRNSMRQLVDLDRIWFRAVHRVDVELGQYGDAIVPGLPETCPFTLDELLAKPFDTDAAVARLQAYVRH